MSFHLLVRVLTHRWRIVALLTLVGLVLAAGWAWTRTPMYEASTSMFVRVGSNSQVGDVALGTTVAEAKAKTYVKLVGSVQVTQTVIDELDLDLNAAELSSRITAEVPLDTVMIEISAQFDDPEDAQAIANAFGDALRDQVADLEKPSASDGVDDNKPIVVLDQYSPAVLPQAPVSPNRPLNLAVGGLLGLLGGIAAGWFVEFRDTRVRTERSLEESTDASVIGVIPATNELAARQRLILRDHSKSTASEAVRHVRTNLQYFDIDNPPRSLVVTSAIPGEGKSTLAANLAVAIAQNGDNVVLIDADLRRPQLHAIFDLVPDVGLTDLLTGRADFDDIAQVVPGVPTLRIVGAGRTPPNPSELLGSRKMQDLIAELCRDAFVILDAPPVIPVTDGALLAARADGAVLVARAGKTKREQVKRAYETLVSARAKVFGLVLNGLTVSRANANYYGYYYGEQPDGSRKSSKSGPKPTGTQPGNIAGSSSDLPPRRTDRPGRRRADRSV